MNVYAIRDRLLEYFLDPFVAAHDKAVMHSLSNLINNGANENHAVAQAPQHFELWRLAEIDQNTGSCKGPPSFLCEASSLVRPGVRENRVQAAAGGPREPHQSPNGAGEAPTPAPTTDRAPARP